MTREMRWTIICAFLIGLMIVMRFWRITQNEFFLYDEGMWLNADRDILSLMQEYPVRNLAGFVNVTKLLAERSLHTGKALWAFIVSLRGFFVGVNGWFWVRLISAISGAATIGMTFLFGKIYFRSRWAGLLSALVLAFYPSHFYYSRIGLQESFTTLCFLAGMYFYITSTGIRWRTFLSSAFFAGVFFANYRMIIIPLFVFLVEGFESFAWRKNPDIRKFVWNTLAFFALIFGIGSLYGGANTYVTFAWMFHQANLAKGRFDWVNLLSYPFYFFVLETFFFGILFFSNFFLVFRKQWNRLMPFVLVCAQMLIFSLPQDKAVRYLCAAMPFAAMAIGGLVDYFWQNLFSKRWQAGLAAVFIMMLLWQFWEDTQIVQFRADYASSIQEIRLRMPEAKFVSTQPFVQNLFVDSPDQVAEYKNTLPHLFDFYRRQYRFLVIEPQAYISFTKDKRRFTLKLAPPMDFIVEKIPPVKTYPHFSRKLFSRIVYEHNENLRQSIAFLKENDRLNGALGTLRVYDIPTCLALMKKVYAPDENP